MNARHAAFTAVLHALRHEKFVTTSLAEWQRDEHPSTQDFALAYEIAAGTTRMALALDYIAEKLSAKGKLTLKLKERALLRTALYQCCFMERVPLYAALDETVKIAKETCHKNFISFLNAIVRNLERSGVPGLPEEKTSEAMSIRYSYPLFFVAALRDEYGSEMAEKILIAGNMPPKTMVRVRPGIDISHEAFSFLSPVQRETVPVAIPVAIMEKTANLSAIADRPEVYIQNATPVALVGSLAEKTPTPKKILDLCASPGGKLLAAHDLYPKAELFANDVTERKLTLLSQNLSKYGVKAALSCGLGEEYDSPEKFDLIILDVPCSNSGVLNKRAEARWRLSEEHVKELAEKQYRLLRHAAALLAPNGVIWYLTCSILKCENEELVEAACRSFGLKEICAKKILPDESGWDGGYGTLLSKKGGE